MMIDVIALAREAGFPVSSHDSILPPSYPFLNAPMARFAQLVQQATAESCVNACKDARDMIFKEHPDQPTIGFRLCIAAIRAKFAPESNSKENHE